MTFPGTPRVNYQAMLLIHDTGVEFTGADSPSAEQAFGAMKSTAGKDVLTYANPMAVERLFREAHGELRNRQFGVVSRRADGATLILKAYIRSIAARENGRS